VSDLTSFYGSPLTPQAEVGASTAVINKLRRPNVLKIMDKEVALCPAVDGDVFGGWLMVVDL
jgi:hypothetical protein